MIGDTDAWKLPDSVRRDLGRPDKRVGRREPAPYEPTMEPSARIGYQTRRDMLAHDHDVEHRDDHRPARALAGETAHLMPETSYYCSRCAAENAEAAVACRMCGARFTARGIVAPLVEQSPVAPDDADTGNEDD
jgi:hypothetical protein